jgi:transposase
VDNARYHHGRDLRPFLQKNRAILRLEFLPAYSPELNPIERVWRLTRRLCTHNHYFPKLQDLADSVSQQLKLWKLPNRTLQRLCCIT